MKWEKFDTRMKMNNIMKKILALGVAGLILFAWTSLAKLAYKQETTQSSITVEAVETKSMLLENAVAPLQLFQGDDLLETTHPSILSFEEEPWNGYRYWMAVSPYPAGDDSQENPCIFASNDLENWETPKGLVNPLSPTPENYEKGIIYNSDPDLIYNSDTNQLECWWRYVDDKSGIMIIYRKISSDGIHWSQDEIVSLTGRKTVDYVSFSVLYEDHMYKMWSVGSGYKVQYTQSKDAKHWDALRTMSIPFRDSQLRLWHMDMIHTDVGYEMIFVAFNKQTDPTREHMSLYYANTSDNRSISEPVLILQPSSGNTWDNDGLYKSTFFKDSNGLYHIIYSGIALGSHHNIGYIKWNRQIDDEP